MILEVSRSRGFTIVELLIVIVIIAILATITMVSYSGAQNNAKNVVVQTDMRQIAKQIEIYYVQNGSYPTTGGLNNVYTDANCTLTIDADGYKGVNWVPGIANLIQNPGLQGTGLGGAGCYTYASDGSVYVLSAWNAKRGGASTDNLYRRLGWRENGFFSSNAYHCNHQNIGGNADGTYDIKEDYYKYSYTISNITTCNETPPPGA